MHGIEDILVESLEAAGWKSERRQYRLESVEGALDYGGWELTTFPKLEGTNIVVVKQGTLKPEEAVVVVAHYDTVRDSPGADDNTASVAGLLELARILRNESF
jgi:acetylornithine deacetylase/succinyl-diaminopimelate desuccinylase-like protein